MVNGQCSKGYTKNQFNVTSHSFDGYPQYRRNSGITVQV